MTVVHSTALDSSRVVVVLAHLVKARVATLLSIVVTRRRGSVFLTVSHMAQVSLVAALAFSRRRHAE